MSASSLGRGDDNCAIKVICYDWDSNRSHDLIGEFTTTLGELLSEKLIKLDFINAHKVSKKNYENSVTIAISSVKVYEEEYKDYGRSFLILHIWWLSHQLYCCNRFHCCNGHPSFPFSLHHISAGCDCPTTYVRALTAVAEMCQQYDTDKMLLALGFEGEIDGEVSHEFALNGNPSNPYCAGIQSKGISPIIRS